MYINPNYDPFTITVSLADLANVLNRQTYALCIGNIKWHDDKGSNLKFLHIII